MKILFDVKRMQVGCPLLQAVKGGDNHATDLFDPKYWFIEPTPDMRLYEISEPQLQSLLKMVVSEKEDKCLCGGVGCNKCEPQGRG